MNKEILCERNIFNIAPYPCETAMLNDLEISLSETFILENLKRTTDKIADLEDLDKDRWFTVAYLCNKYGNLERKFEDLEKRNKYMEEKIKRLIQQCLKLINKL